MAKDKNVEAEVKVAKKGIVEKHPTQLNHVFYADVNDNGQFREVAIVKEWDNGSLAYIDIALIDDIDRSRLKTILTGQHSKMYSLWELLDQTRLSNGKNGLDYFHQMVRIKKAPGHVDSLMGTASASILDARPERNNLLPGSEFSDPSSGVVA